MSLIVHKYGGTSLSTAGRIRDVAARLAQVHGDGHALVVVVSAMGGTTNQLLSLAAEICPEPDLRELDMLLTTGERVSMALLAMALKATGLDSISLTGSQSGIITDSNHTRARILDIRGERIRAALEEGRIVIVAGFQGVSIDREVTTLGRGGSDVTAVALAARFAAARCEIYTDVDGVYSANPGRVHGARRLDRLDHQTMIAYARLGAGVLHARAAERAARDRVPLRIRSSFIPGPGTEVGGPSEGLPAVVGIGSIRRAARLDLAGGGEPADRQRVIDALDEARIPFLAVTTDDDGPVLLTEETAIGAAETLCRERLGLRVDGGGRGTLVSVVSRPEVELDQVMEDMVPAGLRTHPRTACEPGVVMALVEAHRADAVVLELHRALVEEGLALDPTPA